MNYNYNVRSIAVVLVHNLTFEFKGESGDPPQKTFAKIGTKSCNSRGFHEFLGLHIDVHSCVTIRGVNFINGAMQAWHFLHY